MFSPNKRIFIGKSGLHAEPFCPFLSNETGFLSLKKHLGTSNHRPSGACQPRPSIRDGKLHT